MEFSITINASPEQVWLWDDTSYRTWASIFAPGSWAKTDWQKGSKAFFLDANGSGMASVIEENIPNEYLSIRHMGMIYDGVEDTTSDIAREWAGAQESYTLTGDAGSAKLMVHMDAERASKEMQDYFAEVWPRALNKVKELSETN